jgi:isopentenyl-diphosphate delta-isomerase
MKELVILVNERDVEIGTMEKMETHLKGKLHRAISVFIFNSKGEMLLQRRALGKYHTAGLWSNSACSHPRINEKPIDSAERRLFEEMGLNVKLKFIFKFIYKAKLDNNLIENELDHVFIGTSDEKPNINVNEVCDYKYIREYELNLLIEKECESFTPWFKECYKKVFKMFNHHNNIKSEILI